MVTLEVSQKLIFELKEVLSSKSPNILFTLVVHKFTLPASIWSPIVALSTTVYTTPSMVAVSPTVASGHLQIPSSK